MREDTRLNKSVEDYINITLEKNIERYRGLVYLRRELKLESEEALSLSKLAISILTTLDKTTESDENEDLYKVLHPAIMKTIDDIEHDKNDFVKYYYLRIRLPAEYDGDPLKIPEIDNESAKPGVVFCKECADQYNIAEEKLIELKRCMPWICTRCLTVKDKLYAIELKDFYEAYDKIKIKEDKE